MGHRKPKRRLVSKVALLYFFMNVISISLFTFIITNNQAELVADNTRLQAKERIQSALGEIRRAQARSQDPLQTIGNVLSRHLDSWVIFQGDSILMASTKGLQAPVDHLQGASKASAIKEFSGLDYHLKLSPGNSQLEFYIPLDELGCPHATAWGTQNMHKVGKRFQEMYQSIALTIIALTFLHLLFALVIHRMVIRPVLLIFQATNRVASGDYEHPVKIRRDDELGALGDGFDNMMEVIRNHIRSLAERMEDLRQAKERIEVMATTDELTGLYNRRHLFERFRHFVEISHRKESFLGVAIIDIDHFKKVNDTYGHQAGDAILKNTAQVLKSTLRKSDLLARYGGEELVVLMPGNDLENTVLATERMRIAVAESYVTLENNQKVAVTVSIGVSEYMALRAFSYEALPTAERLIEFADQSLYTAKESGRNQVRHFQEGI